MGIFNRVPITTDQLTGQIDKVPIFTQIPLQATRASLVSELVKQINDSGIMTASSEIVTLVGSETAAEKIIAALRSNIDLEYTYQSDTAAAATLDGASKATAGGQTLALAAQLAGAAATSDNPDDSFTRIASAMGTISSGLSPSAATALAALNAATLNGTATVALAEAVIAAEPNPTAKLQLTAALDAGQADVVVASNYTEIIPDVQTEVNLVPMEDYPTDPAPDAPRALSRDALTFVGDVIVKLTLPYGKQYTISETVRFSDGSTYTANNVGSLITVGKGAGFDPSFKPSVPVLEAVLLIAAKQTGDPAIITGTIAAVKERAKESPAAAAEVEQSFQLVSDATGTNLGSTTNTVLSVPPAAGACYTQNYVAVSASPDPINIPAVKIGESYEFPDGVSVQYAGVLIDVDNNGALRFDGAIVPEGSVIPGTSVAVTATPLVLLGPPCNSFPLCNDLYRSIQDIYIFKRDSIEKLAAREPLPLSNRVSWAPIGMPAGTLFRDLGRFIVAADAAGKHLYLFRNVQWINGADSEGVGGAPTDVDEWGTGWICTWAFDGVPFCAF